MTQRHCFLTLTTAVLSVLSLQGSVVVVNRQNATSLNWYWVNDQTNQLAANTISYAQTPPNSAEGSIDMTMSSVSDKPWVFTNQYGGVSLSSLVFDSYETFSASNSGSTTLLAPSLQIGIGLNATDTSFRGRLVYSPSLVNTVDASVWDTWNPEADTRGGWFFTKQSQQGDGSYKFTYNTNDPCVINNSAINTSTCTLSAILARNSGLYVNSSAFLGVVGFRTGGAPLTVESSYADMLTVTVTGQGSKTFDFQATPEPSTWVLALGFTAAFLPRLRKSLRG